MSISINPEKEGTGAPRMDEANIISAPEEWVDEYGDYLFRYATLLLRDAGYAEDVVQETFLAALKARENFAGRSSFKTWLTGILKRKIADHIRMVRRESSAQGVTSDAEQSLDNYFDHEGHWEEGPAPWLVLNPRRLFEKKEFWEIFDKCLSGLPPMQADAFTLREIEGMATPELCDMLGVTEANAWVMLHRARMRLRDCLEVNWFLRPKRRAK
jgi:RNA polymerase sigma-70 factor (ECF subfamily)